MAKKDKSKLFDVVQQADKQRVATFFGYVFVFIISIVISAWTVNFDIGQILTTSFIGNLAFNYSIAIIVLSLALRDGDLFFQGRKKGDFHEATLKLVNVCKLVINRGLSTIFPQYWDKRYQIEHKDFIKQQLREQQIDKEEIIELTEEELNELLKEPLVKKWDDGHETVFKVITDEQLEVVLKYKKGKYRFPKMTAQTFFSKGSGNTYLAVATIDNRKKKLTGVSVAYRLGMLLLTSTLISIIVFDTLQGSPQEALVSAVARLFNIFTSMVYGYGVAYDKNRLDLAEANYKGQIMQEFINEYDTGMFVPINLDDQIKAKLKALEEKAKAELVIEEAVSEVPNPENEISEITPEELDIIKARRELEK
ncbi:MAG: hypothetical protein M0R51_13785 [Clostridia bacterium]|jgi:hypothetical protein|nr:hypothetical protein [Clostridia bacterium]